MMNKLTIFFTSTIVVLFLIIVALFYFFRSEKNRRMESEYLLSSVQDSLIVWKEKDSTNHAKISVLETDKTKTFLELSSKDKEIQNLQKEVEKYKKKLSGGGSVSNISTNTNISTTGNTIIIEDTTHTYTGQDVVKIYPTYQYPFNLQGWVHGMVTSNRDSTNLNIRVRNEYTVVLGYESQGLFKPKKPFAEVKSKNPYTEIDGLRTYQVSPPKEKRWGIGPYMGVGFNQSLQLQGSIGLSVQYSIFRF